MSRVEDWLVPWVSWYGILADLRPHDLHERVLPSTYNAGMCKFAWNTVNNRGQARNWQERHDWYQPRWL